MGHTFNNPDLAVTYALEWFALTLALFAFIFGLKALYNLFTDNHE